MTKINLPAEVSGIIKKIQEAGFEAFAVGGCVRDSILGKEPADWDLTTSAKPEDVKKIFARTIDTGIEHGTVTVMIGKKGYEITTYRIDGEYKDGRHPESVEFSGSLKHDLERRDFTINAMAYNDETGLVDEFGGIKDLNNGIIKCVRNPELRFSEDALRMMRAVRFSAQLGFEIEERTWKAVVKLAPTIEKVSMERVNIELTKTLMSDHPEYVNLFYTSGLFAAKLPLLHRELSGKYNRKMLTLVKHSPKKTAMRYASLLKKCTPDETLEFMKNLKMDNNTAKMTEKIVRYADCRIEENDSDVREALYEMGSDFLYSMFEFDEAIICTKEEIVGIPMIAKRRHLLAVKKLAKDILDSGDCITLKDLDISGKDLIEYGIQGERIGQTLDKLLHIVLQNPRLNEKETLIAMIEHI